MFFTGQKTQPTVSKYWRKIYKGKQPPKHKENISQKTWQQAVTLQAVIFSGCLVYFWVVSNVVYFDVVLFLLLRAVFADIFSHRWIVCCSYCALTAFNFQRYTWSDCSLPCSPNTFVMNVSVDSRHGDVQSSDEPLTCYFLFVTWLFKFSLAFSTGVSCICSSSLERVVDI